CGPSALPARPRRTEGAGVRLMRQHAKTVRFWLQRVALVAVLVVVATTLASCGRGSDPGRASGNGTAALPNHLTAAQVQQIVLQAANEATARGTPATIAVVDRVGNVLGVMQQAGATTSLTVSSQRGVASSGLEGQSGIPATLAAISKA